MSVTSHRSRFTKLVCGALMLCASLAFAVENLKDGGPYVPTPPDVVQAMLELAQVGPRDFVVDLGSGDGRIVLAAATRHRARGMGVDIDAELVDLANALARKQEVADRVQFFQQDVFTADLSRATVLTLYLLPAMMERLRPKLLKELKPGTRIVSHDFDFGEWKPDRSIEVNTPEKYEISGGFTSMVHLWIVPAAVGGVWREDTGAFRLDLRQRYQHLEGRFTRGGRTVTLGGDVVGARIRFTVTGGGRRERFTGTVSGGRMTGEMRGGGDQVFARWNATRVP